MFSGIFLDMKVVKDESEEDAIVIDIGGEDFAIVFSDIVDVGKLS